MTSVLQAWAQVDPVAAGDYVAAMPAGKAQESAVNSLSWQLANADVQTAVDWAEKLPKGLRASALNSIISQWCESDPRGAADYALRSTDGSERQNLLRTVVSRWGRNDPESVLTWASALSDSTLKNSVLPGIIEGMAESDPAGAARKVSGLRSGSAGRGRSQGRFAVGSKRSSKRQSMGRHTAGGKGSPGCLRQSGRRLGPDRFGGGGELDRDASSRGIAG